MEIMQVQDIASQKGYKFNNQFFVGYEGNPNFDPENADYLAIKEYIKKGGIVDPEYTPQELLQRAKDQKLAQLRINFNNASQKPFALSQVKQIDKDGKVIGTIDTIFNIFDASSLTASENIVFAGSFMTIQASLQILCQILQANFQSIQANFAEKKFNFTPIDFTAIENMVNALSDNPATAGTANIPYTTKDKNGNEIRVLLSFKIIKDIFKHIFYRVSQNSRAYNIKEEQIKKAPTIEELNKIDITI